MFQSAHAHTLGGQHARPYLTQSHRYRQGSGLLRQGTGPLGLQARPGIRGGIGVEGGSTVWAAAGPAQKPIAHLAFRAKDRKQVDAFHKAALAVGGRDNGKPGLRDNYSPTYYAAFVLDPDGNNVEAVYHGAK